MSGLEALGLACNIFQVISFAAETISACKAIYKGDATPSNLLLEKADAMRHISTQIHQACGAMNTTEEKKLAETAVKCGQIAQQIEQQVMAIVKDQGKGSVGKALLAHTKYKWKKARIDALEKSLLEYRALMESQQLSSICTRGQAIQLQQRHDFEALGTNLQHFITLIAAGHTKTNDLVRKENSLTRTVIKAENHHTRELVALKSQEIQAFVTTEVQSNHTKATKEHQHQRLLGSFKFPEMYQRYHHVHKAHDNTFQRVFLSYEAAAEKSSDNETAAKGISSDRDVEQGNRELLSHTDSLTDTEDGHKQNSGLTDGAVDTAGFNSGNNSSGPSSTRSSSPSQDTTEIDQVWYGFVEWLQSDNNAYWIQGKPGSGKSTLVKFLVEHSATIRLLNRWSALYRDGAETRILSHFFWKIGTEPQNTIRGLLCSLIHQYLSQDSAMISCILQQFKDASGNDSPHDWSTKNLQEILLMILSRSTRALCIFIDGLDEIGDADGSERLLDIVDLLFRQPMIKVCVSSRPEKTFQRRLRDLSGLQLHRLTKPDMLQYVYKELYDVRQHISEELHQQLLWRLVDGANGVFLWLCLVTRSIKTGITEHETEDELFKRLQIRRGDLDKLFEDMWRRLQDDEVIYRSTAAEYFWFVIKSHETPKIIVSFGKAIQNQGIGFEADLSLLEVLAIRNLPLQESLLSSRGVAGVSYEALERYYKKACAEINNRCAGLLEIHPAAPLLLENGSKALSVTGKFGLYSGLMSRVDFIHRTAHDFLLDTETGRRILGVDQISPTDALERRLRARLTMARVANQHFELQFSIGDFLGNLAGLARTTASPNQTELAPVCCEMVMHVRNAYDDGVLVGFFEPFRTFWRRSHGDHFLFLNWLTYYSEFDEFVISVIKKTGSPALATRVLWEAWSIYGWACRAAPSWRLTAAILAAGGDPHAPSFSPLVPFGGNDSPSSDLSKLMRQRTAFSSLLEGTAYRLAETGGKMLSHGNDSLSPRLLEIAEAMAAKCPDLNQTISLFGIPEEDTVKLISPIACFYNGYTWTNLLLLEVTLQSLLLLLRDPTQNLAYDYSRQCSDMPAEGIDQTWSKLRFLRPARISVPGGSLHYAIANWFQGNCKDLWADLSSEPSISGLPKIENELEQIESPSADSVFVEELSDFYLNKDSSELELGKVQTTAVANKVIELLCTRSRQENLNSKYEEQAT